MPKTLIVHIGMHKTGSSSLQNFLHKNRDYFLDRHNIDYCEAYPNHGKLAALFANNYRHFSRIGAFDDAHIGRWKDYYLKTFKTSLDKFGADKFILSGEGFSYSGISDVQDFYKFVEPYFDAFKVVFYARDPISFSQSCAQQFIKSGMTLDQMIDGSLINPLYERSVGPPIENGPETLLPNYKSRLQPFVNVFGKENIIVRNFSGDLIGSNIISDFLSSVLQIDPETLDFNYGKFRKNESLDHELGWFLEKLNRSFPPYDFSSGKIKRNKDRPRNVLPVFSNPKMGCKFRLLDFDFEKLLSNAMPDILWLRDFTKGKIDYSGVKAPKIDPGPAAEIADSIMNAFVAQIRKTDRAMETSRFYNLRRLINQKLDHQRLLLVFYGHMTNPNQATQIADALIRHAHFDDALWLIEKIGDLVKDGAKMNNPKRLEVLEDKARIGLQSEASHS